MTTQLTDSLGATWTYYPQYDQWETEDDRNDTETDCEGCGGPSTLDMDDFLEYILEDLKSALLSGARLQPQLAAQQLEADLEGHCAALRSRLLALRTA